ncbi:hypothetical protein [Paenibacillus pectinilyticus]|nr:hypothetical protein [Paenibacillus pectinilyticus]
MLWTLCGLVEPEGALYGMPALYSRTGLYGCIHGDEAYDYEDRPAK